MAYPVEGIDGVTIVQERTTNWSDGDDESAFELIKASIPLPECHADVVPFRKQPVSDEMADMSKFTLEGVVREWLELKSLLTASLPTQTLLLRNCD